MLKEFSCVSVHLVQYDEIIFAITAMQLEIDWKSAKNALKLQGKQAINPMYIWVIELWMFMADNLPGY